MKLIRIPNFDLLTLGNEKKINIVFAGSGFTYDLAYDIGVRKRLLSWHANTEKEMKEFMEKQADKPSFSIVDSGAFTVWQRGGEINVCEYTLKLLEYLKYFSLAANLDVIPGRKGMNPNDITPQMNEDAAAQGWKNFVSIRYVLSKYGEAGWADRVMPIYHQGERFYWLEKMVGEGCRYIGISPSNDLRNTQRMFWLDDVFDYLSGLNKSPYVHGYGVTGFKLMDKYPWTTVDSASWIQAGAMGTVFTPFGPLTVTDRKDVGGRNGVLDSHEWTQEMREKVAEYFRSLGFELEELKVDYKKRWKANALYMLEYEKNYKLKVRAKQRKLF